MKPDDQRYFVFAKLIDPIDPNTRVQKYEEPLQASLEAKGIGNITGGGTMHNSDKSIEYVGLDILLDDLDASLDFVRIALYALGAPDGSELLFHRDEKPVTMPVHSNAEQAAT